MDYFALEWKISLFFDKAGDNSPFETVQIASGLRASLLFLAKSGVGRLETNVTRLMLHNFRQNRLQKPGPPARSTTPAKT
jgi:hypothetical protein